MGTEVNLSLHRHCIETAAKMEYRRLMGDYFASDTTRSAEIEDKIALLKEFVESSDFPALRASDERLSGTIDSRVTLYRDEDGGIRCKVL